MDKKTAPSGTERIIDIPDSVGRYEAMDLCDALYRAGHTAKSKGSDSCSDARSKPEWLECHAAFNRQGRALLRATTALAEAEARIAELESYNVGLATESHQQQERIVALEKVLERIKARSDAYVDADAPMNPDSSVQVISDICAAALLEKK